MKQIMEFKYKLTPQIEFFKTGKGLTCGESYLLEFVKLWIKRYQSRIKSVKYIFVTLGLTYNRLEL